MDVFWSYFDENEELRNVGARNYIAKIGLKKDIVMPYRSQNFHGMEDKLLFNDHFSEVKSTYGDVEKECLIHTHNQQQKELSLGMKIGKMQRRILNTSKTHR